MKIIALVTLTGLAFVPVSLALAAGSGSKAPCYQAKLKTNPPLWVSGATWVPERERLLVVDPYRNKVLEFDADGKFGDFLGLQSKKLNDFLPNTISQVGKDGYLLELADGTLFRLDNDLSVHGSVAVPQAKDARGFPLGTMYQWKATETSILAYGALSNGKWVGFFRMSLGPGHPVPEKLMKLGGKATDFYLVGNQYIATIEDTAYFVAMGENPAIYRVLPNQLPQKLKAFPKDFHTRPSFKTAMTGPMSAAAHFGELETFDVVSGLYAQGGMLYLLAHRADKAGGAATWLLYKINPDRDQLSLPPIKLPTSAHHITVAPAERNWYLIERGTVRGRQEQTIDQMVVIDSSAIATLESLPNACPVK